MSASGSRDEKGGRGPLPRGKRSSDSSDNVETIDVAAATTRSRPGAPLDIEPFDLDVAATRMLSPPDRVNPFDDMEAFNFDGEASVPMDVERASPAELAAVDLSDEVELVESSDLVELVDTVERVPGRTRGEGAGRANDAPHQMQIEARVSVSSSTGAELDDIDVDVIWLAAADAWSRGVQDLNALKSQLRLLTLVVESSAGE